MRHRHRWPYILALPLLLFVPSLLAKASPAPLARTRHQQQRQLHRLVGGHIRILDPDPNDTELITASAGENIKNPKGGKKGDEERKTLSQQVADGKYGLIQKELFKKTPKRPGIISYAPNPEVPKDNIATLGGLTKNDIWLAENHLLVIKGGSYPPHDDTKQEYVGQIWQPIDDYNAPLHQVKIPKNPAVPPPFPVQLTDDGPLQILGTNSSRTLNASAETPAYALPPPPGWDGEIPPQSQYFPETGPINSDQADPAAGQVAMPVPGSGEPPGGLPFPPALLNGSLPPFFAHLPPGAAILPAPLGNETNPDILDEDDPSIYYPPPYSFYYPKDNTSMVPPGPLVPGIILPPPPKFFAPLEEDRLTSTRKPPQIRPIHTTTKHPTQYETTTELSNEISTVKPIKTVPTRVSVVKNYSKVTVRIGTSRRPQMQSKPTTGKPKLITILPVHVNRLNRTYLPAPRRKPPVTILKPVKPEIATPKMYYGETTAKPSSEEDGNDQLQRQKPAFNRNRAEVHNRQPNRQTTRPKTSQFDGGIISTTQVPLRYHHTTTNGMGADYVTPSPEKFSIGINAQQQQPQRPKTTTKPPTNNNYYFYEETDPALNTITTEAPLVKQNPNYYNVPNNYYGPNRKPPTPPSQFIYVNGRPYESDKPKFRYVPQNEPRPKPESTFSIHIAKLQNQLHQYYSTPQSIYHRPTSKPVYQYSFEAHNYRRPGGKTFRPSPLLDDSEDSFKPIPKYSVQIQPAIEIIPTQQPSYQQIQPLSVDEPSYYSTERPSSNRYNNQYLEEVAKPQTRPDYVPRYVPENQKNPNYGPQVIQNNPNIVVTPSRPIAEFSFEVTPNPVYQGFYTKPDEGYFDENTKQYFTIFGRKIPSSTTPLPVVNRPRPNNYERPISLESDINVNYVKPRPPINPQSEPIRNNGQYHQEIVDSPNPEIIKAIEITPPSIVNRGNNKDRYIHYQLPGDEGAHFYFLTPQGLERRRQGGGGEYFFEREGRVRREDPKSKTE